MEFSAAAHIAGHPAWAGNRLAGMPGFSLPDMTGATILTLTPDTLDRARHLGFDVNVLDGVNNKIVCFKNSAHKLQLDFRGNNNLIVIGARTKFAGSLSFEDAGGHLVVVSGAAKLKSCKAVLCGGPAAIFIGSRVTANSLALRCDGPAASVQIGDGTMISWSVEIRSSDSHGIFSLDDLTTSINPPEPVVIGPHVWLASDVTVMPGCTIGRGAIVGARSLVTRNVEPFCLYAGSPAKCMRERVSWTRRPRPDARTIRAALRDALATPQDLDRP
jgi:carbonic anhydrase/acetyltransferase-like protein (isoleucine patch superfamily)